MQGFSKRSKLGAATVVLLLVGVSLASFANRQKGLFQSSTNAYIQETMQVVTVQSFGGSDLIPCQFPTTYNGKTLPGCTKEDHHEAWCYTIKGNGDWRACVGADDACSFPFTYEGTKYEECTDKDHTQDWCFMVGGGWKNCPVSNQIVITFGSGGDPFTQDTNHNPSTQGTSQPSRRRRSSSGNHDDTGSEGSGDGLTGQMRAALERHNELRHRHGADALTWDASLAQTAQKWADGCKFEHSKFGHGENLYAGYGMSFDGAAGTQSWYDELTDPGYNFQNSGFSSGTGHFTQVVWKGSKKIGCAVKMCDVLQGPGWDNANLFVCEYSPPGNMMGAFKENVLPAQ